MAAAAAAAAAATVADALPNTVQATHATIMSCVAAATNAAHEFEGDDCPICLRPLIAGGDGNDMSLDTRSDETTLLPN